jgi:hypothetical protein
MELYLHSHTFTAWWVMKYGSDFTFTKPLISLIQQQTSRQFGNKLFEIHYEATGIAIYKCLLQV